MLQIKTTVLLGSVIGYLNALNMCSQTAARCDQNYLLTILAAHRDRYRKPAPAGHPKATDVKWTLRPALLYPFMLHCTAPAYKYGALLQQIAERKPCKTSNVLKNVAMCKQTIEHEVNFRGSF
ncbi:hypothetical protein ACU8KH_05177 [Lachancea thermotolerans]